MHQTREGLPRRAIPTGQKERAGWTVAQSRVVRLRQDSGEAPPEAGVAWQCPSQAGRRRDKVDSS